MKSPLRKSRSPRPRQRQAGFRLGRRVFERLVEEATLDAYNESEQATGFFTMLEDNLELPFQTSVLGVSVKVVRLDIDDRDHIVAVCARGRERQTIPLLDLPLPSPRPRGAEWIDAYRHWAPGR